MPQTNLVAFDVEQLPWYRVPQESFRVGKTVLMRDSFSDSRFPNVIFVRYRFPAKDPLRIEFNPFILVSFSGKNCVVHRANKGIEKKKETMASDLLELNSLWNCVRADLQHRGLRIWASLDTPKNLKRFYDSKIRAFERLSLEHEVERLKGEHSLARRQSIFWRAFVERQGFSRRRFTDPKAPKAIRSFNPGLQFLLLRQRQRRK